MKRSTGTPQSATELASTTSILIPMDGQKGVSVQAVYSNVDPGASVVASTAVDDTEDTFTDEAHGYKTGLIGQMTTSAGDLPDGLSTSTDYFVIVVDEDTYQLASSLANAEAGTAIDLSDEGSGNHTFTPTTSADNVAKLQESNDGENWTDVASHTVTIATTAGAIVWPVGDFYSRYLRVLFTPSAGQISLAVHASYVQ